MNGFRKFILRGNLVDLAVAFVIGARFASLVSSFVASFITPLLGLGGKQPSFSQYSFKINNSVFTYGAFLTEVISFVIAAGVVYFLVVVPVGRLLRMFEADQAVTEKDCPECGRSIPTVARRCPECTTVLEDRQPLSGISG